MYHELPADESAKASQPIMSGPAYNPYGGGAAPPASGADYYGGAAPAYGAAPAAQQPYGAAPPYGAAQPYGAAPAAQPYGAPAAQPYGAPAHGYPAAQPYGAAAAQPYGAQPYGATAAQQQYAAQPQQHYETAPVAEKQPMARPPDGNTFYVEGESIDVQNLPRCETIPGGKCGSTSHGVRLDFDNREWRDVWCAILFAVTCVALFIGVIAQYSTASSGNSKGSNGKGIVIVLIAAIVGLVIGFMWLRALKKNAEQIIKFMLISYMAMLCVFTVFALLTSVLLGIIMILITCLFGLYLWCQWHRIVLAAAFISVSAKVIQEFPATVGVTILMLVTAVSYIMMWSAVVVAYGNRDNANGFVVFLLLIAGYWGLGVAANVSHFTTCVVAFSWYFDKDPSDPTWTGLKLASTKSFGSICLGSLIVAIIQAMRAVVRNMRNQRNQLLVCILDCILGCLEAWARFFNMWAYSYCALYGMKFAKAGEEMFNMFKSKGIDMLVTNDFTGFALMAGALVAGLVAGIVGFVLGYGVCPNCAKGTRSGVAVLYAFLSLMVGFYTCWLVMFSVRSGVVALFTAWSEDPNIFFTNHPKKAKKFAEAWNKAYEGRKDRSCC